MITIKSRIDEIKKNLDALEEHVNSTLSILDCQRYPLNAYSNIAWKDFKWTRYDSYVGTIALFKDEEEAKKELQYLNESMSEIHEQNKILMEKNKVTFDKICAFFVQLGLSKTTYIYTGKGRQRHSSQVDSEWVQSLKRQYPMQDEEYNNFCSWHRNQVVEMERFYREKELKRRLEERQRVQQQAENDAKNQQMQEQERMVDMAIEYMISHGKTLDVDFTRLNALAAALSLKSELANKSVEITTSAPKITNAVQFMDIDEPL
jgi:hypothetical protein